MEHGRFRLMIYDDLRIKSGDFPVRKSRKSLPVAFQSSNGRGTHLVVLVHGIVEIEANGMVVATVWPGQRDSSEGGWVAVLLQNIQK